MKNLRLKYLKRWAQKTLGILIILCTILVIRLGGIDIESGLYDATIALITFPIGFWMTFTKRLIVW